MAREVRTAILTLGFIVAMGCSNVQKGSAVGGAVGGAAGAGIGHYATSLGGVPGGLVGLGLGAAAGAIAADSTYTAETTGEDMAATEQIGQLSEQLAAKDGELKNMQTALEKEKAQQRALLQAYEKAREGRVALQANAPAGVQVQADSNKVTFTILSEVLFRSGKASLTPAGKTALHEAARLIRKDYPNARIEVRGHTDNMPIRYSSYKSNWELSCARALGVVHYLIESEGFQTRKLAAVGCGETQPVASNKSEDGRRKNRRAELVVLLNGVQVANNQASR